MEATIQTSNQATSIAINIATMKANIQSALQVTKQRVLKELTLPQLYRKQLRMVNAMALTIEKHPTLTNVILLAMGAMLVYEVLNYEFTTSL